MKPVARIFKALLLFAFASFSIFAADKTYTIGVIPKATT